MSQATYHALVVSAGLTFIALGCSGSDAQLADEVAQSETKASHLDVEFGVLNQALASIPRCANSSSATCWENRADQQYVYTYLDNYKFYVVAGSSNHVRVAQSDIGGGWEIGTHSHPGGLAAGAISITSFRPAGAIFDVYVLDSNSVTYRSRGQVPPTKDIDFTTYTSVVEAKRTDGTSLCLQEIDHMLVPMPNPAGILVGLGCDGKLYRSSGTRWASLQSYSSGYASLPTNVTFTHISRTGLGGTFVASAGQVWLAGQGTWNGTSVVWQAPKTLPALPADAAGKSMQIITVGGKPAVGGKYVLTNAGNGGVCTADEYCDGDADRIYSYDSVSNTWKRFTPSVPWVPSFGDLGRCDSSQTIGQCTATTADDDPSRYISPNGCPMTQASITSPSCCCKNAFPFFEGIQQLLGGGLAVLHENSWVFRYRP